MPDALSEVISGTRTKGDAAYKRGRAKVLAIFAAALVVLSAVGVVAIGELRSLMKEDLAGRLVALRDAVATGVIVWSDALERAATAVAESPRLQPVLRASISGEDESQLRPALSFLVEGQLFHGVALLDAEGHVAEAHDIGLDEGDEALPPEVRDVYEAARDGRPLASRPFRGSDGEAHMLVGAPISADGAVIGVLLLGIATEDFSATLHAARAGESGETYAMCPAGRLISDSRFLPELRELRLIDPDDDTAVLEVDVRDPGGDLTTGYATGVRRSDQPLTIAAEGARSGRDGVNVDGYRDYRGVQVIGAWEWLPRHGFAVITEVDVAEAYKPLVALERLFGGLLVLILATAVVALAVGILLQRSRSRAARAENKAAKLGQYTIEEKLGEGGMGAVYRAHHALLRRPTAIKLLHPTRSTADAHERFEREVRRTAELTHPNTIAIYDYGHTAEGVFYYAMEYLDGVDLDAAVERFGPMPEGRVIHILRQAAGALSEAHAAGMVHRDIKPANIVLCRRGGVPDTVKVLDFGLVKTFREEDKTLTAENAVIGTPAYLPPELVDSAENATPQSDLYALGAVAYFLLTGELVFDGETPMAIIMAHVMRDLVPPSERAKRQLDPALEALVLSCLEKKPEDRPASAEAFIEALDASQEANAWSRADAESWWNDHAEALKTMTAAERESIGTGETMVKIALAQSSRAS